MTDTINERTPTLTPDLAERIYTILVETCGAPESGRTAFVACACDSLRHLGLEWRFQGRLGFGGKFIADPWDWRVGCYPEDTTAERIGMMGVARKRLRALREQAKR